MAHTPLKLLPSIAAAGRARAQQLDLGFSAYVALLVRNQDLRMVPITAQDNHPTLARVHVPCSWRKGLRALAVRLAKEQSVTVNALVESLIAADLLSPARDFLLLARGPKPKLQS